MSIPRSKSAPHSVFALRAMTPLKGSASHADLEQKYFRRPRVPVHTPRSEREDPFNLGTFFPSTPGLGVAEEEEEWNWLHQSKEDVVSESVPGTPEPVVVDELQDEKTIKEEDKLGILSLNMLFSRGGFPADDRLFSPYGDEAVDEESLYLGLCARRQAESAVTEAAAVTKTQSLFW